ncbi:hypothetical protein HOP60_09880 [Halomonas daqingensis]|uniref:MarR family transcriptional regulator n=1 Tax=Billgrantia desiderata TaxID=52021 RepID=A0ABS9B510_9GAMM|nr:hypothetical protein [Halomonas desiderata]MCE8042462.1 hypothetical protein [Halomonas desiderata]MCE8047037.1 hypothetical protein [Halomonas desiderata]
MQPIGTPTGAEVKLGAYLDHIRSGACKRQQEAALAVLALSYRPLTRHEIAELAGMALSGACGRVAELLALDMVEVAGTVKPAGVRSPRSTLQLTEKGRIEAARVLRELAA